MGPQWPGGDWPECDLLIKQLIIQKVFETPPPLNSWSKEAENITEYYPFYDTPNPKEL